FVPALPHHAPVPDHEGTHHGVGRGEPEPALRELQGPSHVRLVIHDTPTRGSAGRGDGAGRQRPPAKAPSSSPIPTVTVGPGVSPGPPSHGLRGVADSHRRWWLAPRPEDEQLCVLLDEV